MTELKPPGDAAIEGAIGKLVGIRDIPAPIMTQEIRKNYGNVLGAYKSLIAELAMEGVVEGLTQDGKKDWEGFKAVSPYMFKREAQVVEVRNATGKMDDETAASLTDILNQRLNPAE